MGGLLSFFRKEKHNNGLGETPSQNRSFPRTKILHQPVDIESTDDDVFNIRRNQYNSIYDSEALGRTVLPQSGFMGLPYGYEGFCSASHSYSGAARANTRDLDYIRPTQPRIEINSQDRSGFKQLSPSSIRYSQDSIATTFYEKGRHGHLCIGQTLDDLLTQKININQIPKITVCWYDQNWFSFDNRRLWIFKKYETIKGKLLITVKVSNQIDEEKLTTNNHGTSIRVRGDPGGTYWKRFTTK